MEDIDEGREISSDELQLLLDELLEREIAQRKRQELSEDSFKEWVYGVLRTLVARLGYTLISFEEFLKDIAYSVSAGWHDGVELAHREAELKRKKRERKYR